MLINSYNKNYKNIIFFYIFLFCFLLTIYCQDEINALICLFPKVFTLFDWKNLVVCKNGIYTYSSNFGEVLNFQPFETEIADNIDAEFNTISQYPNNGNVILITKNKFFLISPDGDIIIDTDMEIDNDGKYYTLVPYKYGNDYNFIVGFINSDKLLNIIYYKINFSSEEIEIINNLVPDIKTNQGYSLSNLAHGFSCQIMFLDSYGDLLTCFYFDDYPGEIGAFSLSINSNIELIEDLCKIHILTNISPKFIKSAVSPDKTKALIGFNAMNGYAYYMKYDIGLNEFTSEEQYTNIIGDFAYTIQVQYYSQSHEYIVSSTNKRNFKLVKFDSEMNIINNDNSQLEYDYSLSYDVYGMNSYNIILIPEDKSYIFITDSNYKGNTTARFYSVPEVFSPENIYPNSFVYSSTTILTTIPTTLLTTIPTPPTTIFTTIPTTVQTTFITTIPTTISTTIPTYTPTYILSSILFTIPTSIPTNIPTIITTTIIATTIPTNIISNLPSTLISSIPYRIESSYLSSTISIISTFPPYSNSNLDSTYIAETGTNLEKNDINKIDDFNNKEPCSLAFFYMNIKTKECENYCSYDEFINELCYVNNLNENNIMNITENFRDNVKKLEINKNTNKVMNGRNSIYQVISSEMMEENKNKNLSIIDFGECEERLKQKFSIDYIIILQLDIFLDNSSNIILKYEVYNPNTLEKIDLSICNDLTINTYLPYSLSDEELDLYTKLDQLGYDLYNPNDSFYHDLCTPFTTDKKTDILLSDRRLDIFKNKTFCEEGCTYKHYDYLYEKVQCECNIKEKIEPNIDNIKFYGNLLFSSFFELKNFSNIEVIRCFKLVFSKLGQIKNLGSYLFIVLILIFFILMILFYIKGKKQLYQIVYTAFRITKIKAPIKKKNKTKIKSFKKKSNKMNNIIINKNIVINNHNYIGLKESNKTNSFSNINNKLNNISKKNLLDSPFPDKSKRTINKRSRKFLFNKNKGKNKKNKIRNKNIKSHIFNYNDYELNTLAYDRAIIYDKRTYGQYYCSLLKQKHLIIFTFISKNDYNLLINKLSLFIFSFSLYFTVNALFFDNDTIHKNYINQGNLKFIYNILHIIYSTLISSTVTILMKLLALSNNSIIKLKNIKNNKRKKALENTTKLINQLYCKFNIFYLISFLLLDLFWYFISAFCAVYNNSQILLFENTLTSFGLSLIYPFGLNLLPGIFRISALRAKDKNKNCLYSFANFISIF